MTNGFLEDVPEKFLNGKEKPRHKTKPPEIADDDMPIIIYHVIKCPKCKSKNCWAYKTKKLIQYRKCSKCGLLFKSVKQ